MYIKEIKINGFKSFADKTFLELDKNFTGIVGPNGSGKSNIVDAIRWVLGEQSVKNLRGSTQMTDVIFGGSKRRGESTFSSVSLVFDNSDKFLPIEYNEVEIKRIVYKNGDNEYYLNNDRCRLKDITDLFLDSFSSKSSFNIIQQGKISEILSSKPEERRIIFEEAAGVVKYKKRKDEALRRLDRTHENIERIDMIIGEIENNLKPINEQAKKAIEYKDLQDKLENIDVSLMVKDILKYNLEYKQGKLDEEELISLISKYSADTSKEESHSQEMKLKSIHLDEDITQTNNSLINITNELSLILNKKELAIEREKYDKNSSEVKNKLIELKEKRLKEESLLKSSNLELIALKEEELRTETSFNKKVEEENLLQKDIDAINYNIQTLNKNEIEQRNNISILNSNIASMARVPFSVKTILNSVTLPGIHNIIGNIIKTDEKYSICVDIALGSSSNFVIVDDEDAAKEAITYLKNKNAGRVTFFPLTVIKPRSIDSVVLKSIEGIEGYLGLLCDKVECDKVYYNIIHNVLGNIILADNQISAKQISRRLGFKYRVVTLSGELFNVGGSITGGSVINNGSIVKDKYDLERINKLLSITIKQKEEVSSLIQSKTDIEEKLKQELYTYNVSLMKLKDRIASKDEEISIHNLNIDKISTEINDLGVDNTISKTEEIMNEYYSIDNKKKALEIELKDLTQKRKSLNEEINSIEDYIKKNNSKYNEAVNKQKSIEVNNTKLSMLLDNCLTRLNEDYSLTFESARDKYEITDETENTREEVSEIRKRIKVLGDVNLGSIEESQRINKRYEFLTTQKEDLKKSEEDLLSTINQMDEVMIDKFKDTFVKINKEFNKVFNSLFSGGEAHLELSDPNNILETGIDIYAYPPGKKLSAISLLSGGEKTLTAISLLFSIMNLKKVPFVVFDEVESALDEENVDRFGKYLENYKGKTQFLIITHKKKTMEYVDLLYGITMQECGVSKLVSVKLSEI
ncbi:MAG: AAA family ATPase [Bacilli bacterium]